MPSKDIRKAVLATFQTKQEMVEEWTRKNVPEFQAKLLAVFEQPALKLIPTVLVRIVLDYAHITTGTWLDTNESSKAQ